MPVTVGSGTHNSVLTFSNNDAQALGAALAAQIGAAQAAGTLTQVAYTSGSSAPAPASGQGGVVTFSAPPLTATGTATAVTISSADPAVMDNAAGPVSIQGGAAGSSVVAGLGGLSYTAITPSGTLVDQIAAAGGDNLIQTSATEAGNYNVATGSGNDTVNILAGNATVSPGSGVNLVNLGPGNSLVISNGFDSITGAATGGGSDTVNIVAGQTSITSGSSGFLINDNSASPAQVQLGPGGDTVNLGAEASATFVGAGNAATFVGAGSAATVSGLGAVVAVAASGGDSYRISGQASATVSGGAGSDLLDGGGTMGAELFRAGSGNDTLIAGEGGATLGSAQGFFASAVLESNASAPTTFSFTNGQSSGSDTITGFKPTDVISFAGYGSNPQGTALVSGQTTVITLSDGTTIHVVGAVPAAAQYRDS